MYLLRNTTKDWASLVAQMVKNQPANAGDARDAGFIPGLERSPGEGNGNPLQYSYLENSMDRGAWWATVHGVTWVGHDWATITHSHHPWIYSILPTIRKIAGYYLFKNWLCLILSLLYSDSHCVLIFYLPYLLITLSYFPFLNVFQYFILDDTY